MCCASPTGSDDPDNAARVVSVDAVAVSFSAPMLGVGDRVLMQLMPRRRKVPASVHHFELQGRHYRQGVKPGAIGRQGTKKLYEK